MPGEPIDVLGKLIPSVGSVPTATVVNVPFYVTALGATTEGIPLLTLVSKYPTPTDTYITVSTLFSTQTVIDQ